MNETNDEKREPMCQCGKPKSAHNILALVAPKGSVSNGPYADRTGQVFCWGYREAP